MLQRKYLYNESKDARVQSGFTIIPHQQSNKTRKSCSVYG